MSTTRRAPSRTTVAAAAVLVGVLAFAGTASVRTTSAAYTDLAKAETPDLTADVPPAMMSIRQANALDTHAAISDGRIYLWGFLGTGANPGGGQLGAGVGTDQPPRRFAPLDDVVDVSSNAYGYKALDSSGRLWTWGTDGFSENGGRPGQVDSSWAPLATDVLTVASSEYANAWVAADGSVWTTGTRAFGQRGTASTTEDWTRPTRVTLPPDAGRIVTLGGAYEGFYAVDEDSRVYFWGRDYRGGAGLGINPDNSVQTPVEVPALTALIQAEGLAALGGGYAHGALLTGAGNVYTWGTAEFNANGHTPGTWRPEDGKDVGEPRLLLTDVEDLFVSFMAGRALMADGTVQAWGSSLWGGAFERPDGSLNSDNRLTEVYDGSAGPAVAVGGTKDSASYSLRDGSLWTWGENGAGAACGGPVYAQCPASRTATGDPGGLYVWPPVQVEVPS